VTLTLELDLDSVSRWTRVPNRCSWIRSHLFEKLLSGDKQTNRHTHRSECSTRITKVFGNYSDPKFHAVFPTTLPVAHGCRYDPILQRSGAGFLISGQTFIVPKGHASRKKSILALNRICQRLHLSVFYTRARNGSCSSSRMCFTGKEEWMTTRDENK